MVEAEVDYRSKLVVVDVSDGGWHEDYAGPSSLPHVLKDERHFPVVLPVGLGRHSIVAHIEGVRSGLADLLDQFRIEGELYSVGVELDVVVALLMGHPDDLYEVVPQRWFAARELDGVGPYRILLLRVPEHLPYLFERWLVDWLALLGVEEAVPAGQIAAVCENDVEQTGVRAVPGAHPAVERTVDAAVLDVGAVEFLLLPAPLGEAVVQIDVLVVEIGYHALGAALRYPHLTILLPYECPHDAPRLGADGHRPVGKRSAVGSAGLFEKALKLLLGYLGKLNDIANPPR